MQVSVSRAPANSLMALAIAAVVTGLALHIITYVRLEPVRAEPLAYVAASISFLGAVFACTLFVLQAGRPLRYRWAFVVLGLGAHAINYLNAADSELHAWLPRSLGFWSVSIAFAFFLLGLTSVDVAGARFVRALDACLVLALCLLRYIAQWAGGGSIYVHDHAGFLHFFLASDFFLLAAAGIAALAASNAEELRFARLMILYFVLESVAGFCSNELAHLWFHQEVGSPWFLTVPAAQLLFVTAAIFSYLHPRQDVERHPNLLARGTMPIFLTLAVVGMGIALLPSNHHSIGLAAIVLGCTAYALRTIYMQRHFVLAQKALHSRNTHLEDLLDRDTLTGIGNRRSLAPALDRLCAEAYTAGQSVYLFLIDIDRFKQANDSVGHLYGDRCLLTIASTLARELRPTRHHLARYGGDEFAVILRSPDRAFALETAEFLRLSISELKLGTLEEPLTLSIGIAAATIPSPIIGHLIESADRALYRAKDRGRDRIEFALADALVPDLDPLAQPPSAPTAASRIY